MDRTFVLPMGKDRICLVSLLPVLLGLLISGVCRGQQVQGRRPATLAPYEAAISTTHEDAFDEFVAAASPEFSITFQPWWSEAISRQLRENSRLVPIDLETLIIKALEHSAQVQVFSDLPLIRETAITEADAAFDWHAFMETRWDDISEPVGNTLTTGGPPRFRDEVWTYSGGVRRKNTIGGRLETFQEFGHQDNNSVFFQPKNQGTARLVLSYTQPLLRGAGRVYNTSLTVLAAIDADIAEDEFLRQLQSHLLEVTRAYWSLYLERGALLQKRRSFQRALETLEKLQSRRHVDVVESQIIRVRAAVAERRALLVRAATAVNNAQDRIQALINDPQLRMINRMELLPTDSPMANLVPVDMQTSLSTALQQRPEINQSLKQIKASSVRLNMAKHELLPRLDLVLETYVAGLRGSSDISQAWVDQLSQGEPSYSVGLLYEVPIWRRAPQARWQRRRLENRQLQNQFRSTVETLLLEVKVAVREVTAGYHEALAKYESMQAARQQLEYIEARWEHLPGEDRSVNLYLEDMLAAQERLADAEFGFLRAQTTYSLALINLKRAMGTLLQDEQISQRRACDCNLPRRVLHKPKMASATDSTVPRSERLPQPVEPPVPASAAGKTRPK